MSIRAVDDDQLVAAWEMHRQPLVGLATSILKDPSEAEDAVQEAFLRLAFQTSTTIDDVRGWLIVVVTRLCIDHVRSARHRREAPTASDGRLEVLAGATATTDPAELVAAVDDLRSTVATLLDRLSPAEQAAFVLHDVFGMPFDEIATALRRSPVACRQLASRARRALEPRQSATPSPPPTAEVDAIARQFAAACEGGSIATLLRLLAPDVVGVADFGRFVPRRTLRGRRRVADRLHRLFGRGRLTLVPVAVDGAPALVVVRRRDARIVGVLRLDVEHDRVVHIDATNRPRAIDASLSSRG